MEWRDDGLIIGTRKHGETSLIVEAMTRAHGRHFGLVRGGRSKRMQPLLQPGNHAELVWRARLDEHLGTFLVEPVQLRTARLMASAEALHAVCHVAALLRLGPERDPHPALYETAMRIAGGIDRPRVWPRLLCASRPRFSPKWGLASILRHAPRPAPPTISFMCRQNPDAPCRRRQASPTEHGFCRSLLFCGAKSRRRLPPI